MEAPENCECVCHAKGDRDPCQPCVGWHLSVLRHTVAKLLGNWHMAALVEYGGLLNQKDKCATLPGHSLGT